MIMWSMTSMLYSKAEFLMQMSEFHKPICIIWKVGAVTYSIIRCVGT